MAEVALGAIGAVPVFVSVCEAFLSLKRKIGIFRNYKREIGWLYLKLSVNSKLFQDLVHHIVIATLASESHRAQCLRSDRNHPEWKNPDLEAVIKRYMGNLFEDFVLAVELAKDAVGRIQDTLDAYAPPSANHPPTFRAFREKLKLAFHKGNYQQDIEALESTISSLETIKKLAIKPAKQSRSSKPQRERSRRVKSTLRADDGAHCETMDKYGAIRDLSCKFQEFLQKQWSCHSPSHSRHSGRLFLNFVSMERTTVAWLLESEGKQNPTTKVSNRLLFNVWRESPLLTPKSDKSFEETRYMTFEETRSPKRQRTGLSPQPYAPTYANAELPESRVWPRITEHAITSLCKELEAISLHPQPQWHPLIRDDAQHGDFYRFVPQQPNTGDMVGADSPQTVLTMLRTWDLHEVRSIPLSSLLIFKPHQVMLDRDRRRLAAGLVRATLMGYSTPGWPGHQPSSSGCIMEGISFLVKGDAMDMRTGIFIQALLGTLHIPVKIGCNYRSQNSANSDADMTGVEDAESARTKGSTAEEPDSTEDILKFRLGVRCPTLYRLGVGLLSIALWEKVDWREVESARKKAAVLKWGGKVYRTAVKSLIDCDFGVGDNLDDEKLQSEILRSVVGPLEESADLISTSIKREALIPEGNLGELGHNLRITEELVEEPDGYE